MVYFAVKIKIRESRYPDSTTASFAVSDYQGTAPPSLQVFRYLFSFLFLYSSASITLLANIFSAHN